MSEHPSGDPAGAAAPDVDVQVESGTESHVESGTESDLDVVLDADLPDEALDPEPAGAEITLTGDRQVDAALGRLPELDRLATAEHVAVYEDVHRALQEALGAAGSGAGAAGGPRPAVPAPPRR
ncbi:MAG TPA: hypothetical protein VFS29_09050 [Motilibacteraceae bacterium]|nr:hypothetical protein [Motilibacteraceae bacterium]